MDPTLQNSEEYAKMLRGELYYSFVPELCAARKRTAVACRKFNEAGGDITRRQQIELWRDIIEDRTPLPPPAANEQDDEALFKGDPFLDQPIRIDWGTNLKVGAGTYINFNFVVLNTCLVTIGARVLIGPNVSLFGATHPLDPAMRMGIEGPEGGKEIHIGDDVWIGGGVIILPGVTVGRGATIGAGSVVTKSVEPFTLVAGNPARLIRRIDSSLARA